MTGLYLAILSVAGLFVALLVFGAVCYDTGRRGFSSARRLLLATGFGTSCFGGFLVPYVYEDQLQYTYFQLLKPRPIAISPYEWVTVSIATGLLISVIVGGFYVAGTRYATPQMT
ncbi:hypothetical protein D3D02_14360 [Halobellus sp. Atlit-38R]|uniref:hypothetical protein n=1 Tax=Halobellus sp. Atlit-38R TaxID=2282131 RepID=UPI000EF22EC2|nr:hypothetical protein [Halobellus sp. Atlit-38R]RLM84225.1 hypothetical protein D3D02_14360 [Halobellus sp. Atlit-38R]